MKARWLLIVGVTAGLAHAEVEHPLDFDDSFFIRTPYNRWVKDPFKNSPGFAKGPGEKSAWPKLTGVVFKTKHPYAVLDGLKFKVGQYIDEDRFISEIGQNYVIVTEGNFDYELVIPEVKRGLASELEGKANEKK